MIVLLMPLALLTICGILALATRLEQRRARLFVRLAVRGGATPEVTEALVAAELAPVLAAEGLTDRR